MNSIEKKLERYFGVTSSAGSQDAMNSTSDEREEGLDSTPIISFLNASSEDVFILSGPINQAAVQRVSKEIESSEGNSSNSAILWLTTFGGSPDAAYMIARAFQRKYDKFSVFVDSYCKSSGTLICLGADEIIMGCEGHIGPLDIQIMSKEEFGERHSGLNLVTALENVTSQARDFLRNQFLDVRFGGGLGTRQALEVATNLTGQLFSPITCQLDFMKYGEFTRSMRIGLEYGERLASHRPGNIHPGAVQELVTGYPSHGFVIDREEASEKIFLNVKEAEEDIVSFANELQYFVTKSLIEDCVLFINCKKLYEIDNSSVAKDEDSRAEAGESNGQDGTERPSGSRSQRRQKPAQDKGEQDES